MPSAGSQNEHIERSFVTFKSTVNRTHDVIYRVGFRRTIRHCGTVYDVVYIFRWRSSLMIRGMENDDSLRGDQRHTHTHTHTHTVPLFLSESHQLASFVCYTSHRMPRHLGTFSPPFVSSLCSPSPCLSICFVFHPLTSSASLPWFPHFLSSESANCEFPPQYVVLGLR